MRSALNIDERLGFTKRALRAIYNLQVIYRYFPTPKPDPQWYARFWKIFEDIVKINIMPQANGKIES